MPPSEIRRDAREALKGKWGKAVCIVLAYTLFSFLVGLVEGLVGEGSALYTIIDLAFLVISIPLSFGLIISFMKLKRSEEIKAFDFLKNGFANFGKAWGITWHMFIRLLIPMACLFLVIILMAVLTFASVKSPILGLLGVVLYIATLVYVISRSFLYVLAYHIAYDNPELSSKACVLKSEALMKGNRGNYFLLQLSFIGWAILAVLSLCIGMLWLAPYIAIAEVCFYERIVKPEAKKIEEEVKLEE